MYAQYKNIFCSPALIKPHGQIRAHLKKSGFDRAATASAQAPEATIISNKGDGVQQEIPGIQIQINSAEQRKEKDRALYAVAHDLRNPLTSIISLADMILSNGEISEENQQFLNYIKEISYNSLEFTKEIIYSGKLENSELSGQFNDIIDIVKNCVTILTLKAEDKQQVIELIVPDKEISLFISKQEIWRMITNILSNAIKFSPVGGKIIVEVTEQPKFVQIAIKDNGIGIPERIQDKVFNSFTDARRVGTSGETSTGLGLSICKQIVEKHNGKIWLKSAEKQGTTFFIRLNKPEQTIIA
ncbi:hypothetical protein GCM10023149_40650 [Mucilaginibacter gynuensis]|uniref:histidine kinase n=1 Tax=Mucilaginibacter gynuensis TaxID=1302236 RepID=A0ABP8H339_9SPHI